MRCWPLLFVGGTEEEFVFELDMGAAVVWVVSCCWCCGWSWERTLISEMSSPADAWAVRVDTQLEENDGCCWYEPEETGGSLKMLAFEERLVFVMGEGRLEKRLD